MLVRKTFSRARRAVPGAMRRHSIPARFTHCERCGESHAFTDRAPRALNRPETSEHDQNVFTIAAARAALVQHDVLRGKGLHRCAAEEVVLAMTLLKEIRVGHGHEPQCLRRLCSPDCSCAECERLRAYAASLPRRPSGLVMLAPTLDVALAYTTSVTQEERDRLHLHEISAFTDGVPV